MITRFFTGLLVAGLLALASAVSAQTTDTSLFKALGEKPGIDALSADFVVRLKADPRTGPFFKDTNAKNLTQQLGDQFCVVAGGGCVYEGATMKQSHADLKIGKGDFNALVEVLQDTMNARGIAFSTQNQLLARLAPMHRDIITR